MSPRSEVLCAVQLPPVVAIANGFLFVTLEVHSLDQVAVPGQHAPHN